MTDPSASSTDSSIRLVRFIVSAWWYLTWVTIAIRLIMLAAGLVRGEEESESIVLGALAWSDAIPFVSILITLWILYHLRCFFRLVAQGTPFAPEIPRRTRSIGYAIIALTGLASAWLHYLDALPGPHGFVGFRGWSAELIFIGLVILVLARVFEVGVGMQEEQNLTV
jgi:hypothetical protein